MDAFRKLCLVVLSTFVGSCNRSSATKPLESASPAPDRVPGACHVTKPLTKPFIPPPPFRGPDGRSTLFSYGDDRLWAELPIDGSWKGLRLNYIPSPPTYSSGVM